MSELQLNAFPTSPDDATNDAWQESRRRRMMLSGLWRHIVEEARTAWQPSSALRAQQGPVDTSKNLFSLVVRQLARVTSEAPTVLHDSVGAMRRFDSIADASGLWQLRQGHERLVVGQREAAMRVFWSERLQSVQYESVPADLVECYAEPGHDDPVKLYHYRVRHWSDGDRTHHEWTRDCWDLSGSVPVFRVESEDGVEDLTSRVGLTEFQARFATGEVLHDDRGMPIMPVVWYHAIRTGGLRNAFEFRELVDASIRVALNSTFWQHIVRDASWPQRYAFNVRPHGQLGDHDTGNNYVELSPDSLLMGEVEPNTTAVVGQWEPGGNPESLGRAIRDDAADAAMEFDISPSDIQRVHADARSGYAIEITRDGQRQAQKKYRPGARRGDLALIRATAGVANSWGGQNLPYDGWDIEYHGIPLSLEERRVRYEETAAQADLLTTLTERVRQGTLPVAAAAVLVRNSLSEVASPEEIEAIVASLATQETPNERDGREAAESDPVDE